MDTQANGESTQEDTLYGPQTRLARDNFRLSDLRFDRGFIRALGLIKCVAAHANGALGLLDAPRAEAIAEAARAVADGAHDAQFVVDVFQTGSGTSTNMNANEVIATLASRSSGLAVHPNNHVNLGQSSNDVMPSAIRIAAVVGLHAALVPALGHLSATIDAKAAEEGDVVKTGRTHLMDAVPLNFAQELGCWVAQLASATVALEQRAAEVAALPLGGTAIGTGLNAHPRFGALAVARLNTLTGLGFRLLDCRFEGIAAQDGLLRLSGDLRAAAVCLLKISSDLRWMASGPSAGLGEIELPSLQAGSSIMPGKVNPVGAEAVAQAAAQVLGNDTAVCTGAQYGNFQLNLMLPLIAHALNQSIGLLSRAAHTLADTTVARLRVRRQHVAEVLARNTALVTALNPVVGYELGAEIVRTALASGRPVREVAEALSGLDSVTLDRLMDPARLAAGGLPEGGQDG